MLSGIKRGNSGILWIKRDVFMFKKGDFTLGKKQVYEYENAHFLDKENGPYIKVRQYVTLMFEGASICHI